MRVLLLFTYDRSLELWDKIGIINREISLYKLLLKKNVEFTFLTYGDDSDKAFSSILNGINILPVKNIISAKNQRFRLIKSLLLPLKLKKDLKSVDIIKTNQLEGSWVAWIAKIFFRRKLIVRGGFEWLKFFVLKNNHLMKNESLKFWFKYFWRYFIEFVSYKLADNIIITNPVDIDFIIKKFKLAKKKQHIHLIYNFIDTDLFKPMNLEKYYKRVLFIGRFNPQKNLINLIDAFQYLKGYTLDLIGEGPLKNKMEERASDKGISINFLGKIQNKKLPKIINKYPIFILPSHYEGNPKALLEAMSCGVACVGSDVWGINNIIKHQKNGFLCKKTPKSIANAIKLLQKNVNLRNAIAKKARQYILTHFSLDAISQKEFQIYRKSLGIS